jgi:hypothetical protein
VLLNVSCTFAARNKLQLLSEAQYLLHGGQASTLVPMLTELSLLLVFKLDSGRTSRDFRIPPRC